MVSVVLIYKVNQEDVYKDYETLFVVMVCFVKLIKFIVDLLIHYLFLKFIIFFLSLRKTENRKLTTFNKVILGIVMFLFILNLLSSVYIFVTFIKYTNPNLYNTLFRFVELIAFNIIYLKDTIITLMLCYLFYFKGNQ